MKNIKPSMTLNEAVEILAEGNNTASDLLQKIITEGPAIDGDVFFPKMMGLRILDKMELAGQGLVDFYKKTCKSDLKTLISKMRAVAFPKGEE